MLNRRQKKKMYSCYIKYQQAQSQNENWNELVK
jgi:hypothetical protein